MYPDLCNLKYKNTFGICTGMLYELNYIENLGTVLIKKRKRFCRN